MMMETELESRRVGYHSIVHNMFCRFLHWKEWIVISMTNFCCEKQQIKWWMSRVSSWLVFTAPLSFPAGVVSRPRRPSSVSGLYLPPREALLKEDSTPHVLIGSGFPPPYTLLTLLELLRAVYWIFAALSEALRVAEVTWVYLRSLLNLNIADT